MAGPRICALRIQNGSNNILLDNAQGEIMPVVYTRRSRLLDEELDDEKDITTGNITINSQLNSASSQISMVMSSNGSNLNNNSNIQQNHLNKTDSEKFKEIHSTKDMKMDSKKLIINKRFDNNAVNGSVSGGDNSKSCTQSSSISSEIDLQETVMLRRQQLNRVAEWVQNSSQININPAATPSPKTENNDGNSLKNGLENVPLAKPLSENNLGSNLINAHVPNQACSNNNSSLMYKTNITDNINEIAQNSFNNDELSPTTFSKLNNNSLQMPQPKDDNEDYKRNLINSPKMVAHTSSIVNSCTITDDDSANNNIERCDKSGDKIDLAQMEYNVKQFLLKQNEWSIHNRPILSNSLKLSTSSILSSTESETNDTFDNIENNNINNASCNSNNNIMKSSENCVVKKPQRTETNL